jgi:hypothetical protein
MGMHARVNACATYTRGRDFASWRIDIDGDRVLELVIGCFEDTNLVTARHERTVIACHSTNQAQQVSALLVQVTQTSHHGRHRGIMRIIRYCKARVSASFVFELIG